MTRRRSRLEVTTLEDRVTPVLGAFDVPYAADIDDKIGNTDYSGVVFVGGNMGDGTGFLLDRGTDVVGSRHIVSAAHVGAAVGDSISFFRRLPDGNLDVVTIPIIEVWEHPTWTGNVGDQAGDVSILTLASVAPFGVSDYAIYTPSQAANRSEVGQFLYAAGYGLTGTGFSTQSNNQELQRMTVNATGGQYRIVIPGTAFITAPLEFDATAAQIEAAFTAIGVTTQVTALTAGPYRPTSTTNPVTASRSYEILFLGSVNPPRMTFQTNPADPLTNGGNFGTVSFTTMVNGIINTEIQRLTLTGSGGFFKLAFSGITTDFIPYTPNNPDATAAAIQNALEALPTPPPGLGEVTVRAVTTGQNALSFQIVFDEIDFDIPMLTVDPTGLNGQATMQEVIAGGRRPLRLGNNYIDAIERGTIRSDFTQMRPQDGLPDESGGQGDSGGAGFVILPDGSVSVVSVVSYGQGTKSANVFEFGSLQFNTRLSKYEVDISREAAGIRIVNGVPVQTRYTATLDMQYQFAGNDGVQDTITVTEVNGRVQLWVDDGLGAGKKLYYQDSTVGIDSVRIIGTADAERFIVDPSVTRPVTVDGGFGDDVIVGPNIATAWVLTGANKGQGDTAGTDFGFQNIENLVGGSGADSFVFSAGATLSGYIDGRGGVDSLDFSARPATTLQLIGPGDVDGFLGVTAAVAQGVTNVNRFVGSINSTADTLVTPDAPGVFAHAGNAGTYTSQVTGQTFIYSAVDVLVGGAADDTYNVRSLNSPLTIAGGAGNDSVTVADDAPAAGADRGPVTASLLVIGGDGVDAFRFNGTAADETVTARVISPGTADVLGLGLPAGVTVGFGSLENFLFDGRGGSNTFTALDISGTSLGSPTDPGAGIVYKPTSATGGGARINGVTVGATAVGLFTVNGDPNNAGGDDVLTVMGTSAPGLVSAFGEAAVGDGRDRITVTETAVTIVSAVAGALLPVQIGYTNGFQTFSTLYIAGGNESGREGDTIVLSTSLTFNLVADGMLPSASARPGDRVILSAPGGGDGVIVNDPALGPTQNRVTARSDGSSAGLVGFESGAPAVPGAGMIAVGSDNGFPSTVRVFDRITGAFRYEVTPFPGFNAGVKVASGDVNADGIADLVVGAGPDGGPRVGVFDGVTGAQLYDFFGYEDTFRGGVTVAVGDVDLDGYGDLILGTGPGGGSRVRVLSGRDLTPLRDVEVYEKTFRGGVSVAAADVNGDGIVDLITSAGVGGGPRVVVVDGRSSAQLASFFVFDPNSRTGFTVAGGDVNGDGFADVIAGSGATVPAQVRVFSGFNRSLLNDFYINDPFDAGLRTSAIGAGVRVAVADANGDGVGDIITGLGPGGDAVVRTYQVTGVNPQTNALFPTLSEIRRQDGFDVGYNFGIFVGASD